MWTFPCVPILKCTRNQYAIASGRSGDLVLTSTSSECMLQVIRYTVLPRKSLTGTSKLPTSNGPKHSFTDQLRQPGKSVLFLTALLHEHGMLLFRFKAHGCAVLCLESFLCSPWPPCLYWWTLLCRCLACLLFPM